MISQQETVCVDLDTTRLLNVVLRPHEPERTLREFKDFISNENFAEIAQGFKRKDAANLVDAVDQVCYTRLLDTLSHLTALNRPSDPSI